MIPFVVHSCCKVNRLVSWPMGSISFSALQLTVQSQRVKKQQQSIILRTPRKKSPDTGCLTHAYSRYSLRQLKCPFRKRLRCHFLRLVIESIYIKQKEDRPGSNPDLTWPHSHITLFLSLLTESLSLFI